MPIGAQPRPLINCDRKIVVIWSPKSACTTAYVWFSQVSGFAEDVRKHHAWPHRHRTEVFNHSELYRRGLRSDLSDCRIVRIIRDPYSRAVSIYRHALRTKFAEEDMESFSGGRLDADKGYSFQQFLDLLEYLDMSSCDMHYRPQFHPFEKVRRPDKFINISTQDMFAELNAFEASAALPQTDFKSLDWLHQLEGRRKANAAEIEGDKLDEVSVSRRDVKVLNRFPSYDQLLTPEARARIEKIYRTDFEAYGEIL